MTTTTRRPLQELELLTRKHDHWRQQLVEIAKYMRTADTHHGAEEYSANSWRCLIRAVAGTIEDLVSE